MPVSQRHNYSLRTTPIPFSSRKGKARGNATMFVRFPEKIKGGDKHFMALPRIFPRLLREDYDSFLLLFKEDFGFPNNYDDWLLRYTEELLKLGEHGSIKEITIHPEEFATWCERSGQKPRVTMLRAFAMAKAGGRL